MKNSKKDKLQPFNKFFLFSDVVGRTRSSIPKNDANMTKFLNEQGYILDDMECKKCIKMIGK